MTTIPLAEPMEGLTVVALIRKGRMFSTTLFTEDAEKIEKIVIKASNKAGRKLAKAARRRQK